VNTSYLPSFIRDLKALKKTPIYNTIKAIAFEEIPKYDSSAQISNLKKLKGNDSAYRIRVGDSTLGVWFMLKDTVTLKPLADCQKPHSRLFQSCAIKNKPCILLPKTSEVLKTSEVYNLAWKDATVRQNCFGAMLSIWEQQQGRSRHATQNASAYWLPSRISYLNESVAIARIPFFQG